jgi:uncharacterized protein YdeI (YjbR/CyaY-like superfamily)
MHPEVDAYIGRVKQWQAEIQLLRTILLACKLEETIKWGQPCYTIHDKNIVIITLTDVTYVQTIYLIATGNQLN